MKITYTESPGEHAVSVYDKDYHMGAEFAYAITAKAATKHEAVAAALVRIAEAEASLGRMKEKLKTQ